MNRTLTNIERLESEVNEEAVRMADLDKAGVVGSLPCKSCMTFKRNLIASQKLSLRYTNEIDSNPILRR